MNEFILQYSDFLWFLASFFAVVVCVPLFAVFATRVGLVDKPGGRKVHEGAIPLVGGLCIFPVFITGSILVHDIGLAQWPLYVALTVLLVTGAVDDRFHIHSLIKFAMQFLAAILVVFFGCAELKGLGDLFGFGEFNLGIISSIFSVVAIVLLINAVNLMDGLDGLAGGIGFIILGWMLFTAVLGETVYMLSIILLMGALTGFLFYNMRSPWRKSASIFMGDAGSMSLGLMVGWYAIHLSPVEARVIEPMAVAWVLAVPIWDECAQFYRRVLDGRHPFSPDRGHLHHHFLHAGLNDERAVWTIMLLVFLSGGFGVVGFAIGVPLPVLTIFWIVGILVHMHLSKDIGRYPKIIARLFGLSDPDVKLGS